MNYLVTKFHNNWEMKLKTSDRMEEARADVSVSKNTVPHS